MRSSVSPKRPSPLSCANAGAARASEVASTMIGASSRTARTIPLVSRVRIGRARPTSLARPCQCSKQSSSGSCRGSRSSCRSPAPAHLRIVPAFFGWEDPGAAFTAVMQLGTMAAVLLYFRRDLVRIGTRLAASLRDPDARPRARRAAGLVPHARRRSRSASSASCSRTRSRHGARDLVPHRRARSSCSASCCWWPISGHARPRDRADLRLTRRARHGHRADAGARPGRLALGRDDHRGPASRPRARGGRALLVPAVDPGRRAERPAHQAYDLAAGKTPGDTGAAELVVATILAFITGYAAIAFLLRWLTSHSMDIFVAYRVVLGALVLALVSAGVID